MVVLVGCQQLEDQTWQHPLDHHPIWLRREITAIDLGS